VAGRTPMSRLPLLIFLLMGIETGDAAGLHPSIPLWPNGAPGSIAGGSEKVRLTESGEHIVTNVHAPSITVYEAPRGIATGAGVIVIPGGGHRELWMDHEGYRVAEYLAAHGIAAFVLKYRLANEPGSQYSIEGQSLPDVRRSIRLVRSQAARWHIDPQQVGVMGFSAGGELAALASSSDGEGEAGSVDEAARQSARPSFQALIYPAMPAALTCSSDTPRAFLLAGANDQPAISEGLAELYLRLRRCGAQAELHLYQGVGHGFGLRASNTGPIAAWPQRFLEWMNENRRGASR
jgi:acetyl esterase/lipase